MPDEVPDVFLVAASSRDARENFERTVLDGVSTDRIRSFSDQPFDDGTVPVWGTKGGNQGSWKQIDQGDFLLFYQTGVFDYAARVIATEENVSLGEDLWPNHDEGEPWKYIIFLEETVEVDLPREGLNHLAGYADNFAPQGFMSLNEMGIGGLRGRFGSIEEFLYGSPRTRESDIDVAEPVTIDIPEHVLSDLYFPDDRAREIINQVNSALNAGKHVIFTGPPGTGKTEVARLICAHLASEHDTVFTGHEMTTATSDWSTFETVGGYMPTEGGEGDLTFEPGQVLRRFKRNNRQQNELLIVDEINRADIDKSFGQLFTLLSGQAVQLPYKRNGSEIEILPGEDAPETPEPHQYVMPTTWRLFATMNSYDKTSLYELSYAFMRRFSFISIDAPDIPEGREAEMVREYATTWGITANEEILRGVGGVWKAANTAVEDRKIGPAIIRDVLLHVTQSPDSRNLAMTQAIMNYVFPQLEGVPRRKRIVNQIANTGEVDAELLQNRAEVILGISSDGNE